MNLNKRKYTAEEVNKLLSEARTEYETQLNSQRDRISTLLEENRKLSREVDTFKGKDSLISSTLISAKEKASEMEEAAKLRYSLAVETLRKFSENWRSYFDFLKEKYPNYSTIQKAVKLKEALDESLTLEDEEQIVKTATEHLKNASENLVLTPKERVNEFIATTEDNGFNLEEVLNPGRLELEDLCKELGLME